ncbi:hypothetical protein SKAU_G00077500 [Synaphobranchus kaupii]|uniref:Uncharacterized protein n=1 Tax=Synaphobranchus kaupii TaxID=118154 RepID=A0A9Q1G856_SYNKA|nr:hypothetical protein SKAU_G00077500 [Synaphobranchus kaupii]
MKLQGLGPQLGKLLLSSSLWQGLIAGASSIGSGDRADEHAFPSARHASKAERWLPEMFGIRCSWRLSKGPTVCPGKWIFLFTGFSPQGLLWEHMFAILLELRVSPAP